MSFETKEQLIADLINKQGSKSYLELGVWKADNLCYIAKNCPQLDQIFGIDEYKVYAYSADETSSCSKMSETEFWEIRDIAMQKIRDLNINKIKLLLVSSLKASRYIENGSLDFVFIDAAHDYASVLNDLELWYKKVKKGGIIAGHDYCEYYNGVIKAVNEFFQYQKIELLPFKIWLVRSE